LLLLEFAGHEQIHQAGRVLVRDGQVQTMDEAAVRTEAQLQAQAVAQRVAADPVHKKMA
jgi:hypothetical protein